MNLLGEEPSMVLVFAVFAPLNFMATGITISLVSLLLYLEAKDLKRVAKALCEPYYTMYEIEVEYERIRANRG